jgi:hypothetical protein
MSTAHFSMLLTLTLAEETRVRTAEGDAMIRHTIVKKAKSGKETVELHELANELPKKWVKLPAGTVIHNCGYFAKSETYLCAVDVPAVGDSPARTIGVVLREMSWRKCVASSLEAAEVREAPPAVVTKIETDVVDAIEAAGGDVDDASSEGDSPEITGHVEELEQEEALLAKAESNKRGKSKPSVEDLLAE